MQFNTSQPIRLLIGVKNKVVGLTDGSYIYNIYMNIMYWGLYIFIIIMAKKAVEKKITKLKVHVY